MDGCNLEIEFLASVEVSMDIINNIHSTLPSYTSNKWQQWFRSDQPIGNVKRWLQYPIVQHHSIVNWPLDRQSFRPMHFYLSEAIFCISWSTGLPSFSCPNAFDSINTDALKLHWMHSLTQRLLHKNMPQTCHQIVRDNLFVMHQQSNRTITVYVHFSLG